MNQGYIIIILQSLIYIIVLKLMQKLTHNPCYQLQLRIKNFMHVLILKEKTEQEDIKDFQVFQKQVISILMLTTKSYSTVT